MQKVFSITTASHSDVDSELKGLLELGNTIVSISVTYNTVEGKYSLFVLYY